jgi:hypothetical protein
MALLANGLMFIKSFLRRPCYGPTDDFRNLRDDGVAERSKAVHPIGNPRSHSTQSGFSCPPACSGSCGVCPFGERPRPERQSRAAGLAHVVRATGHIVGVLT